MGKYLYFSSSVWAADKVSFNCFARAGSERCLATGLLVSQRDSSYSFLASASYGVSAVVSFDSCFS